MLFFMLLQVQRLVLVNIFALRQTLHAKWFNLIETERCVISLLNSFGHRTRTIHVP